MAGVILATLGQLIHSLQSVLQWILVSVIVGLALFLLGAFVERHLGQIRDSLQEALETWE
jgi:Na+/H+-dicarboxylate symporter